MRRRSPGGDARSRPRCRRTGWSRTTRPRPSPTTFDGHEPSGRWVRRRKSYAARASAPEAGDRSAPSRTRCGPTGRCGRPGTTESRRWAPARPRSPRRSPTPRPRRSRPATSSDGAFSGSGTRTAPIPSAGLSAYTTRLLPMTGFSSFSAVRVSRRRLDDVPHQQLVPGPRRQALAAERAVEPPVRRVQRVGVVAARGSSPLAASRDVTSSPL